MDDLPAQPGTYALILELTEPCLVKIGPLRRFELLTGMYVYLGSAHGPGGIRARVGRHLREGGKPHWHIDYLRREAEICGYGYVLETDDSHLARMPLECAWSQKLMTIPNARVPIPGFGASDCRSGCPAHLIHFRDLRLVDIWAVVDSLHRQRTQPKLSPVFAACRRAAGR